MWISKDGDERKKELLDASLKLFYEQGYDKTSINDIIKVVGVTKGAFYYYFKSKEEILNTITSELSNDVVKVLQRISEDKKLSALEKLNQVFSQAQAERVRQNESYFQLYHLLKKEENALFALRYLEYTIQSAKPLLKSIIEQGTEEGTMKTEYADEVAELMIRLSSLYRSKLAKVCFEHQLDAGKKQEVKRELLFYQDTLEKVLGTKTGALKIADVLLKSL